MIIFKYAKTGGAEFIGHMDVLRHINKIMLRAKIPVAYSEGFSPKMCVNLSSPLPVGMPSVSEYCLLDTPFTGDFQSIFNEFSPDGIKCVKYKVTQEKINLVAKVDGAIYKVKGIDIGAEKILSQTEIPYTDKRGKTFNARERIFGIWREGEYTYIHLAFGNVNFKLSEFLEMQGIEKYEAVKVASTCGGVDADKVFFG